jgi:hypothetical protein
LSIGAILSKFTAKSIIMNLFIILIYLSTKIMDHLEANFHHVSRDSSDEIYDDEV